jgi:hypothetical protein
MPTQFEFERAADEFRRGAARLDELLASPRRMLQLGVTIGGRFTEDLRTLFDHVSAAFERHAAELRELASTCQTRAQACGDYRSTMRAYHDKRELYEGEVRRWYAQADAHDQAPELVASPGPQPVPPPEPPRPPSWVSLEAS